MEERSAEGVAKILADFYKEKFYGKENSKYRIKKEYIKLLTGKPELKNKQAKEIEAELKQLGYVWAKLNNDCVIFAEGPLHRVRAVKKEMIQEFTGEAKEKKDAAPKKTVKKVKRKK